MRKAKRIVIIYSLLLILAPTCAMTSFIDNVDKESRFSDGVLLQTKRNCNSPLE